MKVLEYFSPYGRKVVGWISLLSAKPALLSTGEVLVEEFQAIHVNLEKFADGLEEFKNQFPKPKQDHPPGSKEEADFRKWDKKLQDFYFEHVHSLKKFEHVHSLKKKDTDPGQTALCLSGGGIRSAAFALGLMQGLARRGLLSKFHYLSTVSGGGYAGAWLMAWAMRSADSEPSRTFKEIEDALAKSGEAPAPLSELRKNQAFLTPKVGVASPDTWAGVAIVIRNMLLNWIVFLPLLASVLLIPRLAQSFLLYWTHLTDGQATGILIELWHKVWTPSKLNISLDPHTWLDGVGALVVVAGITIAMVNRSRPDERAIKDDDFGKFVVLPVALGAFPLVAASCSWLANGLEWAAGCAIAFVFIRALSYFLVRTKADPEQPRSRIILELVAQATAGAVVGLVIWSGLWLRSSITNRDMTYLADAAAVFGVPWFLMAFLAGQVLLAGLTSHLFPRSGDRNREWWARASGWFGAAALGWLGFSWLVIYGWPELKRAQAEILTLITAGSGAISLLGASPVSGLLGDTLKISRLSATRVVTLASAVFILCLSLWIAGVTTILLEKVSAWAAGTHIPWLGDWLGTLQPISLDKPLGEINSNSLILAKQRLGGTPAAMAVLFLVSRAASCSSM